MTPRTPDEIAQWAESRDAERKPAGAAGHLTPEQKQKIRVAYLATGGNVSYTELGARCLSIIGRAVNRETVASCMKGPEYDQLRKQFDTEIKALAVERLKAGILPAADAWTKAVTVAGEKGDHKPARDLLMHTGTIEPLDDDGRGRGPLVLVAVKQGDRHYYQEPGSGRTVTPAQADALPGGASPFAEPLWSDGTRTYTREEKDELFRTYKGDSVVQIGIDESEVRMDIGAAAPQLPTHPIPLMTDGERTYTREEVAALGQKTGRMVIQVGGRPDRIDLGNGPGVPISPAAPSAPALYRDAATGQTYTADEVAELKRDTVLMNLNLPGLPTP